MGMIFMSDFQYIPKREDGLFQYRTHRNTEASNFLKYMVQKGLISISEIKTIVSETNEEMVNAVVDTIDDCASDMAQKIKGRKQ